MLSVWLKLRTIQFNECPLSVQPVFYFLYPLVQVIFLETIQTKRFPYRRHCWFDRSTDYMCVRFFENNGQSNSRKGMDEYLHQVVFQAAILISLIFFLHMNTLLMIIPVITKFQISDDLITLLLSLPMLTTITMFAESTFATFTD